MFGRLFGRRSGPLSAVLRRANREAIRWNRLDIDTEHLLLGLVSYDEEQGSGDALARLGLSAGRVREAVESRLVAGPPRITVGRLPLTEGAKAALSRAKGEADTAGRPIAACDLWFGLFHDRDGVVGPALRGLGVAEARVRGLPVKCGQSHGRRRPGGRSAGRPAGFAKAGGSGVGFGLAPGRRRLARGGANDGLPRDV